MREGKAVSVTKQDIAAAVGVLGSIIAQFRVGVSNWHDLIPTVVGGLVVIAHQLTAFAKSEEATISADVAKDIALTKSQLANHQSLLNTATADLATARKQIGDVVASANAALNNMGAQITAHGSELDGIRRTISEMLQPPAAPTPPAPISIAPPTAQGV